MVDISFKKAHNLPIDLDEYLSVGGYNEHY